MATSADVVRSARAEPEPPPNPIGDFFDWLVSPFIPEKQLEAGAPITDEEMGVFRIRMERAGFEGYQIDDIEATFSQGDATPATIQAMYSKYLNFNMGQDDADEEADRIEQTAKATQIYQRGRLGDYADVARRTIGTIQGDTKERMGRYSDMLTTPGAIRTDAEYGNALAEAEQYINATAENTKRMASHATAQSGLRSSGRAADTTLRAQETAASQKAAGMGAAKRDITSRRDSLQKYLDDIGLTGVNLESNITQGYMDIEAGNVPTAFKLGEIRRGPEFAEFDYFGQGPGMQMGREYAQGSIAGSNVDRLFNFVQGVGENVRGTTDQLINFAQQPGGG